MVFLSKQKSETYNILSKRSVLMRNNLLFASMIPFLFLLNSLASAAAYCGDGSCVAQTSKSSCDVDLVEFEN